ncbi:MAG: hypothetical protein ABSH03_19900 [Candidatus Lustribacter sp.]|jgi:hypothetical protein
MVVLAGCGGGGTVSTTPTAVATPYSSANAVAFAGPVTDSVLGSGTFTIAYTQSGSTVNGTWGMVYTTSEWLNGGSFTGTLAAGTLSGTAVSDTDGECNLTVSATLGGTTSMSGSYVATGCSDTDTATFTATAFTIPTVGTYSGTVTNSLVPAGGTMSLTLTQYNVYLTGSYSDAFATAPGYNNSNGLAYGIVTGPSSISYYLLTPSTNPGCPLILNGTLSGGVVAGSYVSQACTLNETGTFNL